MKRRPENRGGAAPARVVGALCIGVLAYAAGQTTALAAGPFTGYSGSWAGTGMVTFDNGATERIRCRARYSTGQNDNALDQTLQCASASYQFQLETQIMHSNGQISGSWSETVNDVSGRLTGQATDGRIRAVVSGSGFGASVAVTLGANSQSVTMRPRERRVREVSIELRRN